MLPTTFSTDQIVDTLRDYFDAGFYTGRYPDIDPGKVDPLEHYVVFGWKEGRDPCAWFSSRRYLSFHADVATSELDPFLHYVMVGRQEGRRICPADFTGSVELALDATASFVTDPALRDLLRFEPAPLLRLRSSAARAPLPGRLSLHWLVPDFSVGSGGHMTIFRLIRWLEFAGHRSTIWLTNPDRHQTAAGAADDILKHFQTLGARVELADAGFDEVTGDAVIATGWQTVARAAAATGFRDRFYLVQDHEPVFYPMGSHALAAAWTYSRDFACLCASPWLAQLMQTKYQRWARHFWLAYDKSVYHPPESALRAADAGDAAGRRPRIVVYARIGTARRAVELALLALEHLAAQGVEFHVDLFGEDLVQGRAPFPCTSHGVLHAPHLAALYRAADIGICFSATNYSLVPQEMMACGLPVVELDGENTRAIFPDGVVTMAAPHPRAIAAEVGSLLTDPERRARQAGAAQSWVAQFDWEKSAAAVGDAIRERLASHLPQAAQAAAKAARPNSRNPRVIRRSEHIPPTATVCIPTYNGGRLLRQVVERVRAQRAPWPFEIVVVDSTSSDGSADGLATRTAPQARVETIDKAAFQHGRTRNRCAKLARGEFIAFLTQDALPADEFWLYNLVTALGRFPNAAGAFGRHLAWPDANPFTKRDIEAHFDALQRHPLVLSRDTDPSRWDVGDTAWRQVLHFYSDNNSCMRRSAWQEHPYPEVDYGEDQLWADRVIKAGYEKLYVPSAVVYHSHDYDMEQVAERAEIEAHFFASRFGYQAYDYDLSFNEQLASMDNADRRWAMANAVPEAALARRLLDNRARLYGSGRGVQRVMLEKERPAAKVPVVSQVPPPASASAPGPTAATTQLATGRRPPARKPVRKSARAQSPAPATAAG